eukprot:TRINITY_DN596_c0_g1_i1.p1 TRINITY_DN596_c0_g1~~TRINITY_DN596_c0_g1_i1.p1  ORF type:complete len:423 (-),score=54.65 TRINITY_DN596_c0_g1_i1:304-1434(-)
MESFEPMQKKPRGFESEPWPQEGLNVNMGIGMNPNPSYDRFPQNPNNPPFVEAPRGSSGTPGHGGYASAIQDGGSFGAPPSSAMGYGAPPPSSQRGPNPNTPRGDFGGGLGFPPKQAGGNFAGDQECRRYNTPDGCPYGSTCRFRHGSGDEREIGYQAPSTGGKTKHCAKFFSTSGCPYGQGCHFTHYVPGGINALGLAAVQPVTTGSAPPSRKQPAQVSDPSVPVNGYKTKLCNRFNTPEGCRFGDKCHFAHGESDLRRPSSFRNYNQPIANGNQGIPNGSQLPANDPNGIPMQSAPAMYDNPPPTMLPNHTTNYADASSYSNQAVSSNTFSTSQGFEPNPPGIAPNMHFRQNYNAPVDSSSQAGPMSGANLQVY